jgi:hypothetical protein
MTRKRKPKVKMKSKNENATEMKGVGKKGSGRHISSTVGAVDQGETETSRSV